MPQSSDLPETDERLSNKIKQRRCIATRETVAMDKLIRLVLAPDGSLTLDISGKLPGRGAHMTPTRAALDQAIKTRAFARAFKQPVTVPDDFADYITRLMKGTLLSRLSMARRSGEPWVRMQYSPLLEMANYACSSSPSTFLETQPHGFLEFSGIFPILVFQILKSWATLWVALELPISHSPTPIRGNSF